MPTDIRFCDHEQVWGTCSVNGCPGSPDLVMISVFAKERRQAREEVERLAGNLAGAHRALAELEISNRALTAARDENSTRVIQLRDRAFALEAGLRKARGYLTQYLNLDIQLSRSGLVEILDIVEAALKENTNAP